MRLLYFAWVREAVGRGSERVDPPAAVVTIADLLKTRGYATMCIGKWHLGDNPQTLPTGTRERRTVFHLSLGQAF